MTWLAVARTIILLLPGMFWHGFSLDVQQRFWSDIFERVGGPISFRFILQPAMALLAALPDGINDAKHGHSAFFWTDRATTAVLVIGAGGIVRTVFGIGPFG
jgi:hypothetical protein